MSSTSKTTWRYIRGLAIPALLWTLLGVALVQPLQTWLRGDEKYDEAAIREWIEETRISRETLPEMARDYMEDVDKSGGTELTAPDFRNRYRLAYKKEKIEQDLEAMGDPPSIMYQGQLPLFPTIYRMALTFELQGAKEPVSIIWDSKIERSNERVRRLGYSISPRLHLDVDYQLHAYNKRQQNELANAERVRWLALLAVASTLVAGLRFFAVQRRERERQKQNELAKQQLDQAERRRLEEELRRQDAERRHEEIERKLLEQRLAAQSAQQQALELKSQLYASIGIMAGSYAHNIKNLLVRPNDLLRRCLESDGLSLTQEHMLGEVHQTLGTVTERLQQILRTVRRDPSRAEMTRLDLNDLVRSLHSTWADLARDKWKLLLKLELSPEPLWIEGDVSHLQQAVENLLFNARDATYEMRNHHRDEARRGPVPNAVRQALIEAVSWRGMVTLRTREEANRALLEVQDNGIGMTDEVRRRCTETHFSTKRDNAIYEGNSTGMGLGLSFVVVILEHHRAHLEIESAPLAGTSFRIRFPAGLRSQESGVRSQESRASVVTPDP
jgi:signal transduction histidine kinase